MSHPFNLKSFQLVRLAPICFSSPHGYDETTKRDETVLRKDKTWQHLEIGNAPPDLGCGDTGSKKWKTVT